MELFIICYALAACAAAGFLGWDWYRVPEQQGQIPAAHMMMTLCVCAALWPVWLAWEVSEAGKHQAAPDRRYRWSGDGDRYWWRFTYANENRPDGRGREERRVFGLYLTSRGDEDEGAFCLLRMHLLGRTLILRLPALFQPSRVWHEITTPATRHSMLRAGKKPGYWEVFERSYGFLFVSGALHVDYGTQTDDSTTDHTRVYSLPWRAWRHVRFSLYGLEGEHIWSQLERDRPRGVDGKRIPHTFAKGGWHDQRRAAEDAVPTRTFEFLDYDKERLSATTHIEEREWRLGEGRFKWLSWLVPAQVKRSLSIKFSDETGRRKGSWKGGTVGASIEMLPGELHEAAFARYAAAHEMTYPRPSQDDAQPIKRYDMGGFQPYGVAGEDGQIHPSPGGEVA